MNEYEKFKHLLEYFVAHLEWIINSNEDGRGYELYIKPLIEKNEFYTTGQGYNNGSIQNHIKDWENYENGKICINIQPNYGNYKSVKCYLNWKDTGLNIIANWKDNFIYSLALEAYQWWNKTTKRINLSVYKSTIDLGLFDNKNPNDVLMSFYDNFNSLIIQWNKDIQKKQNMEKIQPYTNLLEQVHNLILTGAPGTGKTYIAKQIAKQMIGANVEDDVEQNDQLAFVQFHPSYDYTDFVEGLRPIKKGNSELGFELRDGIFKSFCKKALKNLIDSQKSKEELQKQISLSENLALFIQQINSVISEKEKFVLYGIGGKECAPIIEIDENSFTTKSISGNTLTTPLASILTKYEIFSKYKDIDWTYKEVREKLSASYHHTYFFAFLKAFDSFLQKNKVEIIDIEKVEKKNFVIIIDEINRAEISKVFGELFFSIDPSYRGIKGKVKTQYSNLQDENDLFIDGFFIPENVYIIGTMNDIDRSVECFDFAMRRRFTWKEITAEKSADNMNLPDETKAKMAKLNKQISIIEGLNASYHVGGAYFLDKNGSPRTDYDLIWEYRLEPLLKEYLRGMPDDNKLEKLQNAYNS